MTAVDYATVDVMVRSIGGYLMIVVPAMVLLWGLER